MAQWNQKELERSCWRIWRWDLLAYMRANWWLIVATIVFAFLTYCAVSEAQTTVTTKLYRVPRISWTAPTTNADGTPLDDLAGYRIAVTAELDDVNAGAPVLAERLIDDPAINVIQDRSLVESLSEQKYTIWVAAFDTTGNTSVYVSAPFDLSPTPPAAPGGFSIEWRLIHEIGR